ncbi:PIR Superfamily Protein [Plasmodium ovale wallikeri]|uniref:PIR Superfamily Protein n=1 Tax=Plasmodium ovale wallikeri TaxID=864142 RepID=A0A1A9ALD4_PLAOA|nr:PIR Superfamily Protein [Plasmodium ovale wallikeri]SBT57004.1 PIR Superfamily Protein [Plasmodium ovale wallikeri]
MARKIVTGTYTFCINSNYYEAFVKYVKDKGGDVGKKDSCNELSTSMTLYNNLNGKDICKEFKLLYKLLRDNSVGEATVSDIFSDNDCNFLNYWLNDKLSDNVKRGEINVRDFYEAIKHKDANFFSKHRNLGNHFYNISPEILENMKILYELYHTKQKILDIMLKQDISSSEMNKCPEYIGICQKKYREGLDKCHNVYDDFYKALKLFQMDYKYGIEKETDKSGQCKSISFLRLPEYDPVAEKQRNMMAGKILSVPLILSFVIPLLYKYTPLGPFLRKKINTVKNKWTNSDEYRNELSLLPIDMEDNISDNGEYNIGYYSETN